MISQEIQKPQQINVAEMPNNWCDRMPGFCKTIEKDGFKYLVMSNIDPKEGGVGWSVDVLKVCKEALTKFGGKGALGEYFVNCVDSLNPDGADDVKKVTNLGEFKIIGNDVVLKVKTDLSEVNYYIGGEEWVKLLKNNGNIITLTAGDIPTSGNNDLMLIVGLVGTGIVIATLGAAVVYGIKKTHDYDQKVGEQIEAYHQDNKRMLDEETADSIAKFVDGVNGFVERVQEEATGEKSRLVSQSKLDEKEEELRKLYREINTRNRRGK